jgi:hypothetical protein
MIVIGLALSTMWICLIFVALESGLAKIFPGRGRMILIPRPLYVNPDQVRFLSLDIVDSGLDSRLHCLLCDSISKSANVASKFQADVLTFSNHAGLCFGGAHRSRSLSVGL